MYDGVSTTTRVSKTKKKHVSRLEAKKIGFSYISFQIYEDSGR
jgi:hypothetical protein